MRLGAISAALALGLAGLIGLAAAGESPAQSLSERSSPEPAPSRGPTPARKLLNDDDAGRVAVLEKAILELMRQGQFAEAVAPAQEVLAIRTRAHDADHWETADARRRVGSLARIAAMAPEARASLASAERIAAEGDALFERGEHLGARPLRQEASECFRRILGDDHERTALSEEKLAYNLYRLGLWAEAEPRLRKARLALLRALGERHPDVARISQELGDCLDALEKHAEAGPLFEQACQIWRSTRGEDHPDTASGYEGQANHLKELGNLAGAEAMFRKALELRLKVLGEDHLELAGTYSGLASTYEALGDSAKAEPFHRKALAIRLRRLRKDDIRTISSYIDLVILLQRRGNFAGAELLGREALATCWSVKRPDSLETANAFTRLALLLAYDGREADAEPLLRRALEIHRHLLGPDDARTAEASYQLAQGLHLNGKDDEARRLCRDALEIGGRHLDPAHPQMVAYRSLLASCQAARDKAAESEPKRPATAPRPDATRSQVGAMPGDESRSLVEADRQVGNDRDPRPRERNARRPAPTREGTIINAGRARVAGAARLGRVYDVTEFEAPSADGSTAGRVLKLERIQAKLPADAALVAWLDAAGPQGAADANREHWACVVRSRGAPAWVRIPGGRPGGGWTADDDLRPQQVRELLSRRPEDHTGRWREATRALARQWLAPLEQHLAGAGDLPAATRLIVLPSPTLAGLPIEALVVLRPDGRLKYTLSYTSSSMSFVQRSERRRPGAEPKRPAGPPRMLALGDPVFTAPEQAAPPDTRSSPLTREIVAMLASTRGELPRPLPGTRREVLAIAGLFDHPETLLGSEASEQRLDELARSRRLREFRFLHLATHGKLYGQPEFRSALLLSRDRLPDPLEQVLAGQEVYDGELTAEQVLRTWTLDADLVTLSACWSGRGGPVSGAGPLGFSRAMILAGARTVVLSLWNVDDTATALLMVRFYQNLLGRREDLSHPLPKAEALAEAEHWLRRLDADEVDRLRAGRPAQERGNKVPGPSRSAARANRPYEHPYYWAAFILVGDPN